MPVYRRVLLVFLVLGVVAVTFREKLIDFYYDIQPATAKVLVVDFAGDPIPMAGRADIFQLDRSLFMPSPMPCLGSVTLDEGMEALVLDETTYPTSLQVRFHVAGYGVDYASVDLGKRRPIRLRLGRPVEIKGVVTDSDKAPMSGVRVVALGGSSRGVVLEETTTRADGSYALTGISEYVDFLILRVLKESYTLQEREYWRNSVERVQTDFALVPVPPVHGVVECPEKLVTGALCVSVLNLAGVAASVGKNGEFALHNLAVGERYRLLVQGLPRGFTHCVTFALPGQHVAIKVVPSVTLRGQIISERLGRPVGQVELRHANSTRGRVEHCVTDGEGRFELHNVPTGEVRFELVAPDGYFDGGVTEQTVEVEPKHATESISIRIH